MLFMGRNRAEAIDWVQESLGPVTPRNIAEDTFRSLVNEGVVEIELDAITLLEEMDEDELRTRARNTIVAGANQQAGRRRSARIQHKRCHNRHNRVTDATPYTPQGDDCGDEEESEE